MRMRGLAVLVLVLLAWSADAGAQVRSLELIPFAGYRWGGSMSQISWGREFDTQSDWAYGVALDAGMAHNSAAELYYSHFSGEWNATLNAGEARSGSLDRDDIMLTGIWYAGDPSPNARPYLTAGLGASIYSAAQAAATGHFALSLGAGIRKDVNDKFGIRVDGRWLPAWFATGSSTWCDPYYGCHPTNTGEFYDQVELNAGLMIKLGGK